MKCQRPGCNNTAKKKYCSKICYQQRATPKPVISSSNPYHRIPQDVQDKIAVPGSEGSDLMLAEVNETVKGHPPSLSMTKDLR